jgi:glutamate racemase
MMRSKSRTEVVVSESRLKDPIGVFDSGVGGLSVVREIIRQLPAEGVLYYADNAHVPYGGRPLDEIKRFALAIIDFLVSQDVKMIVMGCNMSSAVALRPARERHPGIPIIGLIEPGAASAVAAARGRKIGVAATEGTVRSHRYSDAVREISPSADVIECACPEFVPLIESFDGTGERAASLAEEYLGGLRDSGVGALVLGCTHYPLMRDVIEKTMRNGVCIVDPAQETVRVAARELARLGLAADAPAELSFRFYSSGDPESFADLAKRFMGWSSITVERLPVSEEATVDAA